MLPAFGDQRPLTAFEFRSWSIRVSLRAAFRGALQGQCWTKVRQYRARQCFTGACLPISLRSKPSPQGDRELRQAFHTWRQTRCETRFLARSPTLFVAQENNLYLM